MPEDDRRSGGAAVAAGNDQTEETPKQEQGTAFRLAAFGALVVVVLFAGYGIGRLNESVEQAQSTPASTQQTHGHTGTAAQGDTGAAAAPHDDTGAAPHLHNTDGSVTQVAGAGSTAAQSVGGLAVTAGGLTLRPENANFQAGRKQPLRFRITAAGGAP